MVDGGHPGPRPFVEATMHKSQLGAICIDSRDTAPDEAGAFWSQVFGCELVRATVLEEAHYAALRTRPGEVGVLLQQVDHDSRVHLDIETDNIEAEARRLETLGARRVAAIRSWLVMEAPTGHRFCLVPPQREGFEGNATRWP